MEPIVYLIGAGPGDPGLITVRGMHYLRTADVVLYDHLVPAPLLRYARATAEKLDVGVAAPQPLEQEAICYLIAEKAREGKVVARLKWGDPFIFDRGGAEALFLHEQGVRFEVVPGVPVAIGASAYAGVPLTYPGGGDTVTFVRGHEDEGHGDTTVDWTSLARLDGTIVCYAGPDQLPKMLQALIAHGRSPADAAALIYNGTLPSQETVRGSLEEIAETAAASNDRRAATLVVGRAVGLRDHLRWFDERPLFGKRILVTRSRARAGQLVELLEAVGAEPILAPMIQIEPPEDFTDLDEACRTVERFDWIVFSSANAVDAFIGRLLLSPLDMRALKGIKLCSVGPATKKCLASYGLKSDLTPPEYRAEALVEALSQSGSLAGLRILVPRSDIGRDVIADELRRQGAETIEVTAYRTVAFDPERDGAPDVYRMLLDKQIDVVTFASASAVRNFVQLVGAEPAPDLLKSTIVASIGPVTAATAAQLNLRTTILPSEYTIPALVAAIVDHFRKLPT